MISRQLSVISQALILILLALLITATQAGAASCPHNLTIITDSLVQNTTIRFRFGIDGKSSFRNVTIEYWVEDMAGAILKARRETSNLGWKTYTPKTDDPYSIYLIKANLILQGCTPAPTSEQPVALKNPSVKSGAAKYVCKPVKEGISLSIDHVPKAAPAGEDFKLLAGIDNQDNHTQEVQVYSYLYRGSKLYSTSKKSNLVETELSPGASIQLELSNSADLPPGDYKLKLVAEYAANKTKELTTPITIAAQDSFDRKIRISYFGISSLSKSELLAELNSTLDEDIPLRLVLESDTDLFETELIISSLASNEARFPLRLPLARNHFFLRLYKNNSLLDISELVLENSSAQIGSEKPFTFVQGDLVLNTTRQIYSSSSAKSLSLAPFILLAASIILNMYLLLYKKKS